jgi:hypothetical protein
VADSAARPIGDPGSTALRGVVTGASTFAATADASGVVEAMRSPLSRPMPSWGVAHAAASNAAKQSAVVSTDHRIRGERIPSTSPPIRVLT